MDSVADLTAFYELVHPPQIDGWRCLTTLPGGKQWWFEAGAAAAMAAKTLELDALGTHDVYFGCSIFSTKKREARYAFKTAILYADVDTGPGKPYGTAEDAYGALQGWLGATGLLPPLIVGSGGGLHTYWPLRDPLRPDEWRRGAAALRALADQHGLHIDPTVTGDLARILRPPHTHNRKLAAARPVRRGTWISPYTQESLSLLFGSAATPSYLNDATLLNPKGLEHINSGGESVRDRDVGAIVAGCRQIARLRDERGGLSEPEWYAVLGVLGRCGPAGRAVAHEFSAPDPRYTHEATEAKLDHAVDGPGPITCQHFSTLNLACSGCPHEGRIPTPLALGEATTPASQLAPTPPALTLPPVPHPFAWNAGRLVIRRDPTEGDPSAFHVVAEYPVYLAEMQAAERGQKVSALFRAWEPMPQAWREFSCSLGEVLGTGGRSVFGDHGVTINRKRWDHFYDYLHASNTMLKATRHYGVQYGQFGWKRTATGPAYAFGSDLLQPNVESCRLHGTTDLMKRAVEFEPAGTVAEWSKAATRWLSMADMEAHSFTVAAAFAAPLYAMTGETGCTVVHAMSMQSGAGKTYAFQVASSAFGNLKALRMKPRDTEVAKFIMMGMSGNHPVIYDELRKPPGPDGAERIKDFVLQATLGEDKSRGAVGGGLRDDAYPWSTLLLTAANLSLVDTCSHDGTETAQAARIFEFTPPPLAGLSITEADALLQTMRDNRGTAGRAFVQYVLDHYDQICAAVPRAVEAWQTRLGAGPDQRFIVRLLGVVTVALSVLEAAGILRLNARGIMGWAEGVARGGAARITEASTHDVASIVGRLLNEVWPATLVMPQGYVPKSTPVPLHAPSREITARVEWDSRSILIDRVTVQRWMERNNFPVSHLERELLALGILVDKRKKATLGAGWRGAGQVHCWHLNGRHEAVADALETALEGDAVSNVVALRG